MAFPRISNCRKRSFKNDVKKLREIVSRVQVDERIEDYIVRIVTATRDDDERVTMGPLRYVDFGASPRASIYLYRCAKVRAVFAGRSYVIPEDVKAVAPDVLRHRIVLSYEADSEDLTSDDIVDMFLSNVAVP